MESQETLDDRTSPPTKVSSLNSAIEAALAMSAAGLMTFCHLHAGKHLGGCPSLGSKSLNLWFCHM